MIRVFKQRRGVSVVLAALFMILIFFLILVTYAMVQAQERAYVQAVVEENQRDVERLNERIEIIWGRIDDDGNLNLTIKNIGDVTAHLVDCWIRTYEGTPPDNPLGQVCHEISIWIKPGHSDSFIPPGIFDESLNYTVKIVTERGNMASVQVPYPWIPPGYGGGGGGIGFYPIIIETKNSSCFQFIDTDHILWTWAWEKDRTWPASNHIIYRVLVNNTTDWDIVLDESTVMVQSAGTQAPKPRFIVAEQDDPFLPYPVVFSGQKISPKDISYIYFAAETPSDPFSNWVSDKNLPICPVSFLINFYFDFNGDGVSDTELLTLGLPMQLQKLG